MTLWTIALVAVALFCLVRGIVDLRQRRYVWGAFGILACLLLLTTPLETHAVKYDLQNTGIPE